MSEHAQISEETLKILRQKYFIRLRQRIERIVDLYEQSKGRELSVEEYGALRSEAHSLIGSGKTYGFPEITEAAAVLEAVVVANENRSELFRFADTLISVCESVIQNTPIGEEIPEANKVLAPTEDGMAPSVAKSRILLIDDDPAMQDMVSKLFENDAVVLIANDGPSGLEMLRAHKPTLTLLDISMPGMGGFSLLESIEHEEELRHLPVMMLSAHRDQSYVAKAMLSWALGYIVKPFDVKAFSLRVRSLLERLSTTVLIADDDEAILDMLWHKFRVAGIRTICARDGNEAQELIATERPKLALIDWMMPGLDGAALLRRVQGMAKSIRPRMVMLTVRHQEQDILDMLKLGAEDYITKPFFPDEVVMRSLRLLGLKNLESA